MEKSTSLTPFTISAVDRIMRFLHFNGWPSIDPFTDTEFTDFHAGLDSEMKRLQSTGYRDQEKTG